MATKKKNPHAVAMGRKRWHGVTREQRQAIGRKGALARWRKAKGE